MPLFTFLLGMLVRSLIGKKGGILLGSLLLVLGATRLPAPTINVSHSSRSASTLLLYCITCTSIGAAHFDLGLMLKRSDKAATKCVQMCANVCIFGKLGMTCLHQHG